MAVVIVMTRVTVVTLVHAFVYPLQESGGKGISKSFFSGISDMALSYSLMAFDLHVPENLL
jgi:hypothetical protein